MLPAPELSVGKVVGEGALGVVEMGRRSVGGFAQQALLGLG